MEAGFHHRFTVDNQNSPENSDELPPSPAIFYDTKATSTSSTKRSKRGTQKRVVHVPIKEVEGSHHHRLKLVETNNNAPPSDSWAWRKYGQKPIKGSPYPRGYYRCSSSKGCPARKQVERSRTDPTMVMVTYSCDHNHPWPASRNHHHHPPSSPPATSSTTTEATDDQLEEEPPVQTKQITETDQHDKKFTGLEVGPFVTTTEQYGWFSDLDSTSSTMLESPLLGMDMVEDSDMATIFSIREDEESFFADLGELPECTTVFRRRGIERVEEHSRNLAPWCGSTG